MGRVSDAVVATEQFSAVLEGNPIEPFLTARELTLCSASAPDRAAAKRYADRAVELLRKAQEAQWGGLRSLGIDPAFNSLRSRADFRDLLADAAFPANPFTR